MFIPLNNHDIANILDWVGEPTDLNESELRTYEKLLQIRGMQKARLEVDRARPRRETESK